MLFFDVFLHVYEYHPAGPNTFSQGISLVFQTLSENVVPRTFYASRPLPYKHQCLHRATKQQIAPTLPTKSRQIVAFCALSELLGNAHFFGGAAFAASLLTCLWADLSLHCCSDLQLFQDCIGGTLNF